MASSLLAVSFRRVATSCRSALTAASPGTASLAPRSNRGVATLIPQVQQFVDQAKELCAPDNVHLFTGTQEENQQLIDGLVQQGTLFELNQEKRPGCYLARTDPKDVARAEADTFICSTNREDAGPTNNWADPVIKKQEMSGLFRDCMKGRTMYVVPFSMGPWGSEFSKIGIQITDSAYVAANMRIMTRAGLPALEALASKKTPEFVACMHSVGRPILPDQDPSSEAYISARSSWPCDIDNRNVCHFPDERQIWSYGSGYGGNSLLGKKCFALRIASVQARDEGWLAEHMLILGLTSPEGEKRYVAAAFPSACGKTNLAMLKPSLPGWKVETVGDDIAWMRPNPKDGRLYAINPEFGFFGVAPGTSSDTNPHAVTTMQKNTLFTNVGLTEDGDVYWEGMGEIPEGVLTDWHGRKHWQPTLTPNFKGPGTGYKGMGYTIDEKSSPCAQSNSRFTTPMGQCPVLDDKWDSPEGVPIDAIIFGGRRKDTIPLVYESFDWNHGTFFGASLRSQATSASDQSGMVHDPMAMKPFIGYNVKDYFAHWLKLGDNSSFNMPKVFQVNWFQENDNGDIVWPGFGDNSRVLDWIFRRCANSADAVETPIGHLPVAGAINTEGLSISDEQLQSLFAVDIAAWQKEAKQLREFFESLHEKEHPEKVVPQELFRQLDALEERLAKHA